MGRTRTNIEIDDDVAVVEPMTDEEFLAAEGAHALGEVPPDVPPRS